MTTRPGYIWSGSEWVSIGQEAVVAPVSYQTSAPSTPSTGDIWIDSNDDVPGIDTSQFLRWRKTMSGGETSVSGTDDTGLTLAYTANYEQVYLNGVLLVRGQDYTATNGTSITGLTALAANDVVEVFGVVARVVGDTYTQAQTNSLLDAKSNVSTTSMVLLATATPSAASTVSFTDVFTSSYTYYRVAISITASTDLMLRIRARMGSSDYTGTNNAGAVWYAGTASNTAFNYSASGQTYGTIDRETSLGFHTIDIFPTGANMYFTGTGWGSYAFAHSSVSGIAYTTGSNVTGFTIFPSTGTITGTIKVYGYK